ncbi:MAG: flmD [Caulobacteraceae bacterium]|nr:flmD [Caulobacteraceae bacterium]
MRDGVQKVLLLADYGPRVGGGHAMRSLSLAQALARQGARAALAAPPGMAAAMAPFWPKGVETLDCQALLPQGPSLAEQFGADLVVIDHYRAEARYEAEFAGAKVAVIDDLADRRHAASLVIDPGFGRKAGDYAELAPGARILAGPSFALLRPEFAASRPAALARRGGELSRLLVSLGLTDVGAVTGRAVAALRDLAGGPRLDVVVGSGAPSRSGLERLARLENRVELHIDAADMAGLIARADLAVGAGGSSVWERMCLGLPGVTLVLADNQAEQAFALEAAGLTLAIDARQPGFEPALIGAFGQLIDDAALRRRFSEAGAALCDGAGAQRAAQAVLELLA